VCCNPIQAELEGYYADGMEIQSERENIVNEDVRSVGKATSSLSIKAIASDVPS
jgi:hypothetical protein